MATIVASNQGLQNANHNKEGKPPQDEYNIPEIIEEQRKEADGKFSTHRYVCGDMLGKVTNKKAYYFRSS
jgi:hypothetical protein